VSRGTDTLRVLLLSNVAGSESGDPDWLIPAPAVAEVVSAKRLAPPRSGAPDWLIGTGEWRGISVPAVRLGEPPGPALADTHGPRVHPYLAICRGLVGDPSLTFFAIESPTLPRLDRVGADLLSADEGAEERAFAVVALRLKGRPVILVDLESLERSLIAARPWA
jgi:chemotaxis signal transduction protein